MKLIPKPHQVEAFNAIQEELKVNDRVTIGMACGTGKTKLQTMLIDLVDKENGTIVVFAPTLLLINQLLKVWLEETGININNFVVVCSDKRTGIIDDIDISEIKDTTVKVAKSEMELNSFYKNSMGITVALCTYNSSELLKNWNFDLGIFDEAHKTVGQVDRLFSFALDNKNIKINKRVFMTATKKNAKHKMLDVYSMNSTTDFGRTAYDLSFRKAIEINLILDYKILITIITKQDITRSKINKNTLNGLDFIHHANAIAIQKAIKKYNLNKIVTFHNTIENAKKFSVILKDNTNLNAVTISSEQSKDLRSHNMSIFKNSQNAIATNARCLTEGIDVPDVDAVFFANDKSSIVDIVQAAGRTMRKSKGKQKGYIILPIYLETFGNSSFTEVVKDEQFELVWSTLNALSEIDETLVVTNTNLFNDLGRKHKNINLSGKLGIISNEPIDESLLIEAIGIEAANSFAENFEFRLKQFKAYFNETKGGFVPEDFHDQSFAYWAKWMRKVYSLKQLPLHKINSLLEAGFIFNYHDYVWNETFLKYKEARSKVTSDYEIDDQNLKVWLVNQRVKLNDPNSKNDQVFVGRLKKLKKVGFDARSVDDKWLDIYNRVKKAALESNGIENINSKDIANYGWINSQRKKFNKLNKFHQDLLLEIGFSKILEKPSKSELALKRWFEIFDRVELKSQEFGGINNIPSSESADYVWLSYQRKNWKKLNNQQKEKLLSVGFEVAKD